MTSYPAPAHFSPAPIVILVADLTGYARGFSSHSDAEMASFLERYYRMASDLIAGHGGRVIKFIGDAVLSTFPPDGTAGAVAAAIAMEHAAAQIADDVGLDFRLGSNIHFGDAIASEFGMGANRRLDVVGRAVNQAFLLGRGRGIRMSERAYRKLPSADRAPWEKRKPPVVYVLGESEEPYAAFGKAPAQNALRW